MQPPLPLIAILTFCSFLGRNSETDNSNSEDSTTREVKGGNPHQTPAAYEVDDKHFVTIAFGERKPGTKWGYNYLAFSLP